MRCDFRFKLMQQAAVIDQIRRFEGDEQSGSLRLGKASRGRWRQYPLPNAYTILNISRAERLQGFLIIEFSLDLQVLHGISRGKM